MIQPLNGGIYEYLWFEHKYSVLARSEKLFESVRRYLSKDKTVFLKRLAAVYEKPEENYPAALLNLYDQIKDQLDRKRKEQIIQSVIEDREAALKMLFEEAIEKEVLGVLNSRIFYTSDKALYKTWQSGAGGSLCLCFGTFQLLLPLSLVLKRVAVLHGLSLSELLKLLQALRGGLPSEALELLSPNLINTLTENLLITKPIYGRLYLNPQIELSSVDNADINVSLSEPEAAVLILERIWDSSDELPEIIGDMPEEEVFCSFCKPAFFPWNDFPEKADSENLYKELSKLF